MIRLFGFACGVAAMLLGILLGGELWLFIDYPSMTITIGGGFAFCLAVHSPAALKDACTVANGNGPISLEAFHRHDAVLETLSNTTIASGAAGSLIGMVNMLANLDDPKNIGPACAVAILTLLYAAIVSGMIVNPLRGRMKSRIDGGAPDVKGPSATVPSALIFLMMVLLMTVLPVVFN